MLNLDISEETRIFREEIKSWLAHNTPPSLHKESSLETFVKIGREWQKKLSEGKWLGVHWPKEFGGRGLTLVEEAIAQEELGRAQAPQILGLFGLTMVGPVLIKHGTELQKKKYLSKILDASEIWCQGFSEPQAGSDLINIKTKAIAGDGGFLVTGQKVWTSFAHIANWCFLLARTSDEEKRHKGLTYLLVDMKSKGISVRPLKQITGDSEFNEVFFDQVFVPKENIVGTVGQGWEIALSTLMYERVVLTFARHLQSEHAIQELVAKKDKLSAEQRKRLSKEIIRSCAVRALAYKHLASYSSGKDPGPEGSMDKLFWSHSFQEISKLACDAAGTDAAYGIDGEEGSSVHRYLYSRGRTIAAGTSEIQRNIIAERILGMPKGR